MRRKEMKAFRISFISLFFLSLFTAGLAAAEKPLASPKLTQALVDEVSGEIAYRYTDRISQFDRVQASEGWHDAAVWIKGELEKIGYKNAVSAEYGPQKIQDVMDFFVALEKAGLVKLAQGK
jgi:hypothetical protein